MCETQPPARQLARNKFAPPQHTRVADGICSLNKGAFSFLQSKKTPAQVHGLSGLSPLPGCRRTKGLVMSRTHSDWHALYLLIEKCAGLKSGNSFEIPFKTSKLRWPRVPLVQTKTHP